MTATEQVYVIGTPGSDVVKIGRSVDVQRRLADLSRMSPVPLEVLWIFPGGARLESALHRLFAARRSHGEWFRFESSPVETIRDAVENGSWKVHENTETRSQARRRSADEIECEKRALAELDQLTAEYLAARQERDEARGALHESLVRHLSAPNIRPCQAAEHSPYDRNHVGRIAKAAGIPPARRSPSSTGTA